MRSTQSHRKNKVALTQPADTSWRAVRLSLLGRSGELAHAAYRLAAGGTGGDLEVKVIDGAYPSPGTLTSAEIAAIPDEDVVYHETGITLAPHATTATKTNIVATVNEAAVYDVRGDFGNSSEDSSVFLAYKSDGTLTGAITVVFRALNTGR